MILVDANLLLYAHAPRAAQHEASRQWLESIVAGPELVRFAWVTLWAFLRITTNPRAFDRPLSAPEAGDALDRLLAQPSVDVLEPGDRHWDILKSLISQGQAIGPLVMDATLAAIAIEHGAVLATTDRDFSRFPGLKWTNPLSR